MDTSEKKKKKDVWKSLFSKEEALEEAQRYDELPFFKKSKNVLVAFILVVSVLSVGISLFGDMRSFTFEDIVIDVVIYMVLLPFVYLNHRWAIILVCLLYAGGKAVLIANGMGASVSHLIFLIIAVSVTYKSFIVATYLKKQKKSQQA